jgi:hypothetical protein
MRPWAKTVVLKAAKVATKEKRILVDYRWYEVG